MRADFHRRCRVRNEAIEKWNFDIAWWAHVKIDEVLDEYLRTRAVDEPVDSR